MLFLALLPLLVLAFIARSALREDPPMRAICPICGRTSLNHYGLSLHMQASHPNCFEVT